MILHGVAADPDHFDAFIGQFVHIIPVGTSLCRAAARQIGGVEIKHKNFLAHVIGGLPRIALVVGAFEDRGRIAYIHLSPL